MTLKTITDNSATFTDETFTTDQLLTIANKEGFYYIRFNSEIVEEKLYFF